MKILIVLLRLKGGVGRANTEIKNALIKKGHEVDILSREDNLKIHSFFKSIFPLRKKIKQLMKKNNYDIIYTQDYSIALTLLFPYFLFWKKHFSCFCGTKTNRHPELIQWHHKLIQKIVGKIMGKKLVVIGDKLKKRFPKSTLIYRGVNFEKFKPLSKKRNCLCWMERDTENISKDNLQKISYSTGLKFAIAKGIPPEKMNKFYNKCKVFVSLPTKAGYNNIWNETMASGVPIVIGNKKGAGTMLPFDKVLEKDKIKKINQIIKNPKKINYRKWLIDNGFSWEDKAKSLIKFFEKNINKK
tara:strand:- start:2032 stop:2931 length:900 start_codon:yes stop_codon:yes gene_type:complete